MNFNVYVIVEAPILDQKYELLIPIDRRIHDVVSILKQAIPELSKDYYSTNQPNIYSKTTGQMYDMNIIIKNSNIRTGTRLLLI